MNMRHMLISGWLAPQDRTLEKELIDSAARNRFDLEQHYFTLSRWATSAAIPADVFPQLSPECGQTCYVPSVVCAAQLRLLSVCYFPRALCLLPAVHSSDSTQRRLAEFLCIPVEELRAYQVGHLPAVDRSGDSGFCCCAQLFLFAIPSSNPRPPLCLHVTGRQRHLLRDDTECSHARRVHRVSTVVVRLAVAAEAFAEIQHLQCVPVFSFGTPRCATRRICLTISSPSLLFLSLSLFPRMRDELLSYPRLTELVPLCLLFSL
jgi:hypothetical protein